MNRINQRQLFLTGIFLVALLFSLELTLIKPERMLLAAHRHDYPSPTAMTLRVRYAIALVEPEVPVVTESVEYVTIDGQAIRGYYAYPEGTTEPLPGIIAIHEWWGLNENIKAMTRRLAGEGYQVLAVDLYNGQIAQTPQKATQLVLQVTGNPLGTEANITKAYNYLTTEKKAPKVATIGWCFGGSWSLKTALIFPEELDAAVIYYGSEVGSATSKELSTLKMPILGIFGGTDETIPLKTVEKFQSTLEKLGKKAEFHIYDNAGHAFANPSGKNYVPEAAEEAWEETTEFLEEHLS
ncbi:MAG: dienelactone hydrolase family protein [Waterburya sp.]